jgi:PhoU domain
MDDPIDRLNRGMLQQVLEVSEDKQMLEWGIRMYVVSRQIERIGDNAVDIGEQVAFLVTGEFGEFTDASHPEIEHPSCWSAEGRRPEDHNPTPVTHPQQVSKQSEPLLAVPWRRRDREDPGPSWWAPVRR